MSHPQKYHLCGFLCLFKMLKLKVSVCYHLCECGLNRVCKPLSLCRLQHICVFLCDLCLKYSGVFVHIMLTPFCSRSSADLHELGEAGKSFRRVLSETWLVPIAYHLLTCHFAIFFVYLSNFTTPSFTAVTSHSVFAQF